MDFAIMTILIINSLALSKIGKTIKCLCQDLSKSIATPGFEWCFMSWSPSNSKKVHFLYICLDLIILAFLLGWISMPENINNKIINN